MGGSVKLVCTSECHSIVIFRARSRERPQLSLPGRFLGRCVFTLCITMEVEPRTAKQYKCRHRTKEGGKSVFASFFGWPENRNFVVKRKRKEKRKTFFWVGAGGGGWGGGWGVAGHPIAWATSYYLLPNTSWVRAFKNAFKFGSVNFANSLPPLSVVKKVRTGRKSSQGT